MIQPKIYLLIHNGNVEIASKDVKVCWMVMCKLLQAISQPIPASYVTITRHINEHGTYVHNIRVGQS